MAGEGPRMQTVLGPIAPHDLGPTLRGEWIAVIGLATVYSLGEVSASRLVATPGGQSIAHDVFSRMHFGLTPDLAAQCLVLLATLGAVTAAAGWVMAGLPQRRRLRCGQPPQ